MNFLNTNCPASTKYEGKKLLDRAAKKAKIIAEKTLKEKSNISSSVRSQRLSTASDFNENPFLRESTAETTEDEDK